MSKSLPYQLESDLWPGAAKLLEEMGELQQVLGKIMAFPDQPHPDGTDYMVKLHEEIGDVQATLVFFCKHNKLNSRMLDKRMLKKLDKFKSYRKENK